MDLKVDTDVTDECALLLVSGELDAASSPVLIEALELAETGKPMHLVIDLTDLSFMDSTGISVLVRARNQVHERDGAFHVVNVSGGPRKALELTGLYDLVVLADRSVAEEESPTS